MNAPPLGVRKVAMAIHAPLTGAIYGQCDELEFRTRTFVDYDFMLTAARSGLAVKNFIDVGAGVIDADYRGNVGVILFNFGDSKFVGKISCCYLDPLHERWGYVPSLCSEITWRKPVSVQDISRIFFSTNDWNNPRGLHKKHAKKQPVWASFSRFTKSSHPVVRVAEKCW